MLFYLGIQCWLNLKGLSHADPGGLVGEHRELLQQQVEVEVGLLEFPVDEEHLLFYVFDL